MKLRLQVYHESASDDDDDDDEEDEDDDDDDDDDEDDQCEGKQVQQRICHWPKGAHWWGPSLVQLLHSHSAIGMPGIFCSQMTRSYRNPRNVSDFNP